MNEQRLAEIEKECEKYDTEEYETIIDLIQALRDERAKVEWISVNDRLPNNGQEVDVWVITSLGDKQRLTNIKFVKDHWESYYDEIDRFEPINSYFEVLYWMPLPKPPIDQTATKK